MTGSWDSPLLYKSPAASSSPLNWESSLHRRTYLFLLFAFPAISSSSSRYTMTSFPNRHQALYSPASQHSRRDSVTSQQAAKPSNINMLRISNLIHHDLDDAPASSAATAARFANDYTPTPTPTPGPDTPPTPSSTKPKNTKDAAIFKAASTKGHVKYKPYECITSLQFLSPDLRAEIAVQHKAFNICPSGRGDEGLIGHFPRHIPYASEKKGFFAKTGRDAFEGMLIRTYI